MCLFAIVEGRVGELDDTDSLIGGEIDLDRVVAVALDVTAYESDTDFPISNEVFLNKEPDQGVLPDDRLVEQDGCFLVALPKYDYNTEIIWSKTVVRCDDFRLEDFEGELMLYHPQRTQAVYLNETSAVLWRLCDGQRNCQEIADLLVDAYPDQKATVINDVQNILDEFVRLGIAALQ
jgi:hypothetical protein